MSKGPGITQRRILDAVEAHPGTPGRFAHLDTADQIRDAMKAAIPTEKMAALYDRFSDDRILSHRDLGAQPAPWLTIADIFGEDATVSQRESARRAMRRLADAGRVEIGLVERDVPINRPCWRYIDGGWQRREVSQERRPVTAVRALTYRKIPVA